MIIIFTVSRVINPYSEPTIKPHRLILCFIKIINKLNDFIKINFTYLIEENLKQVNDGVYYIKINFKSFTKKMKLNSPKESLSIKYFKIYQTLRGVVKVSDSFISLIKTKSKMFISGGSEKEAPVGIDCIVFLVIDLFLKIQGKNDGRTIGLDLVHRQEKSVWWRRGDLNRKIRKDHI